MKYFKELMFILLFLPGILRSQTSQPATFQVYPPNAYALGRYGDIPVDYSTGVPDISIPLMSISDKDITVNISLSYHATGIKVDQEATWVGLGWVLNAGGVITRDIRGKADKGQARPIIEDFEPAGSDYNSSLEQYLSIVTPKIQQIASPSEDFYDGESDIYYYNFNGRSGKFFLDNNNNVCLFKHDDIIIDKNTFTVTDDSGLKYFFDKPGHIQQGSKTYATSWYLTKITSPAGGEINFEYENITSYNAMSRQHTVCFIDASTTTGSLSVHEASNHAGDLSNQAYIYEPLLSKITTKSGHYINLSAPLGAREDFIDSYGRILKEISLYDNQNILQKGVELNYGYFRANTVRRYKDRNNNEVVSLNYLNSRLRLEAVKEFSLLNGSRKYAYAHKFEYYGDNDTATDDVYTLPYRLSPSQDHWGYYNYSYNKTIFPGNSNQSYPHIETDPWFTQVAGGLEPISLATQSHTIYGANREPNAEAVKAGTLNKVIYPTGGYTLFDYEVNQKDDIRGGLRVKQIKTGDNNGHIIIKNYSYSGISDDLVNVNSNTNYYHTYLYNPILYFPEQPNPEDTHNFTIIRNALSIMGVPQELVYNENYNIFDPFCSCGTYLRVVKIDGTSPLRLGIEGETAYSDVKEEVEGLGSTEYHYSNCNNQYEDYFTAQYPETHNAFFTGSIQTLDSYWDHKFYSGTNTNSFTYPYPSSIDYGWQSKLLTNKRIFDKNGSLVAEDSIFYATELIHAIPNFKVVQLSEYNFTYTRSYNIGGFANISKEVNQQYMSDGRVVRMSKEYDYLSPYHKKVTEKRTSLSQGGNIKTKYYYPQDYGDLFSGLKSKNIIVPIDVRTYRGSKLAGGKQIEYNDNGQQLVSYSAETGNDIPFDLQSPFTFSPRFFSLYNSDNTLRSQALAGGTTSIYLWSYKAQQPIAQIQNASYEDIKVALNDLSESFITDLRSKTEPSSGDMAQLNALRSHPLMANAQVTTYTYKPLVGMTSMTDARGQTTYYEYDSFQRLQSVKDAEGNIIKSYQYHYKSNNP